MIVCTPLARAMPIESSGIESNRIVDDGFSVQQQYYGDPTFVHCSMIDRIYIIGHSSMIGCAAPPAHISFELLVERSDHLGMLYSYMKKTVRSLCSPFAFFSMSLLPPFTSYLRRDDVDVQNLGVFDEVNVYGDIIGSDIHNMYYGMYSYGHQGGVWTDNLMHDNHVYGEQERKHDQAKALSHPGCWCIKRVSSLAWVDLGYPQVYRVEAGGVCVSYPVITFAEVISTLVFAFSTRSLLTCTAVTSRSITCTPTTASSGYRSVVGTKYHR